MPDPLALSAQTVLVEARTIARNNIHHAVEPAHILYALTQRSFVKIRRLFMNSHRPNIYLPRWIVEKVGSRGIPFKRGETIPLGPQASHIVSLALKIAIMRGSRHVTEDDLLLAFVYDEDSGRTLIEEFVDDVPVFVRRILEATGDGLNPYVEEQVLAGHGQ